MHEKIRHGPQDRLRFIEFRLYWEGSLGRKDLTEHFEISAQQASADLAAYRQAAESNIKYDSGRKRFVPTPDFRPIYFVPSSEEYLAQLSLLADETLPAHYDWLGQIPDYAVAPRIRRRTEPATVRAMVAAIRGRHSLIVNYQSLSTPTPTHRRIAPHAIVSDGHRWHARAWCFLRERFSDFVLARITEIYGDTPGSVDAGADVEWQTYVTLRIGPHPGLDEDQRRTIEMDFGMEDGPIEVTTRLTLAYYLERRLYLDLDASQIPAARQQIVLLNRDELEKIRADVREHLQVPTLTSDQEPFRS